MRNSSASRMLSSSLLVDWRCIKNGESVVGRVEFDEFSLVSSGGKEDAAEAEATAGEEVVDSIAGGGIVIDDFDSGGISNELNIGSDFLIISERLGPAPTIGG
jgi:hypothetical protein